MTVIMGPLTSCIHSALRLSNHSLFRHYRHADEHLAVLRHISLNLLHQERSSCVGIHAKRLKAGWDNRDLLHVLGGVNEMRLPGSSCPL
jgi:hypothetical protein